MGTKKQKKQIKTCYNRVEDASNKWKRSHEKNYITAVPDSSSTNGLLRHLTSVWGRRGQLLYQPSNEPGTESTDPYI